MKKHWYKIHITYCPVCGNGEEKQERQRIYGEPPADPSERYEVSEHYDYCLE